MSWSPRQRQWLEALGYELLVPGRVGATPAVPAMPDRIAEDVAPRAAPTAANDASRLLEALRRAAGGADPRPLAGDLERLRRDPAAKRALWPRLRVLRRQG